MRNLLVFSNKKKTETSEYKSQTTPFMLGKIQRVISWLRDENDAGRRIRLGWTKKGIGEK
jgi:hypothetical protein